MFSVFRSQKLSALGRRLSRPKGLWTTAIYTQNNEYQLGDPLLSKPFLLSPENRWWRSDELQAVADPFLVPADGKLFLFVEAEPTGGPGRIDVYSTDDGVAWTRQGTCLSERHHLAYPFVFSIGPDFYLIPHASSSGEVPLYQFHDFPFGVQKVRTLLRGTFSDSSAIKSGGIWYLFTTSEAGLQIFYTDDLREGVLKPHVSNPIVSDAVFARCGGGVICFGGELFRLGQDCSQRYGGNLQLFKVEELSPTVYSEKLVHPGLLRPTARWNRQGGHHVSIAPFQGKTFVAVDGLRHSYVAHKLGGWVARRLRKVSSTQASSL